MEVVENMNLDDFFVVGFYIILWFIKLLIIFYWVWNGYVIYYFCFGFVDLYLLV